MLFSTKTPVKFNICWETRLRLKSGPRRESSELSVCVARCGRLRSQGGGGYEGKRVRYRGGGGRGHAMAYEHGQLDMGAQASVGGWRRPAPVTASQSRWGFASGATGGGHGRHRASTPATLGSAASCGASASGSSWSAPLESACWCARSRLAPRAENMRPLNIGTWDMGYLCGRDGES